MLAEHATREMRIADLEIHGWRPIKDTPFSNAKYQGVYNESLCLGFALRMALYPTVVRIRSGDWRDTPFNDPKVQFCDWADITDTALDRIDKRLAET